MNWSPVDGVSDCKAIFYHSSVRWIQPQGALLERGGVWDDAVLLLSAL